jgi:undecaprenyl-diphosphatase
MKKKNKIIFVFGILIFLVSFLFDKLVFQFVDFLKNSIADILMNWITHFGSVFVVLIFITSLFLWEEKKREWIFPLWLTFVISIGVTFFLKLLTQRIRPIGIINYPFINLINYSFPSMHTAVAFAAIPILDKEFPKLKLFWILFACFVGFSRIYFKMHYLSDVIFGALLGYCMGLLVIYLEEKYRFFKNV